MPSPNGTKRLTISPEKVADFRRALVRWRALKGRARSSVVRTLGITVQQLANIEMGRSEPSERVYLALCRKMGVKPAVV